MSPAIHRAVQMAARLATTGQVARARAAIAALPPGAPIVIEVNETVPIARPVLPSSPTRRIPYVSLADEATAWVAEYRAARGGQ